MDYTYLQDEPNDPRSFFENNKCFTKYGAKALYLELTPGALTSKKKDRKMALAGFPQVSVAWSDKNTLYTNISKIFNKLQLHLYFKYYNILSILTSILDLHSFYLSLKINDPHPLI